MSIFKAVILGIIQGITQFLPVSSSGHFAVISGLLSTESVSKSYPLLQAFMHIGTLAALLIVFWSEIVSMLTGISGMAGIGPDGGKSKAHFRSARLFLLILAATLPAALVLPFGSRLQVLSENGLFIGTMFMIMGCVMYVSGQLLPGKKHEGNMSFFDAIIVGFCQLTGVIPGMSRMGVTLTGGLAVGLKRSFAMKFAYLTSIPASIAVIIAMFVSSGAVLDFADMPVYIAALIGAMISGIGTILGMRFIFEQIKLHYFGLYSLVAGVVSIILTLIF